MLECSDDQTIKIWEIETGMFLKNILTTEFLWSMEVLLNKKIASGDQNGSFKIWNAESDDCFKELEGHDEGINMIKK